MTHSINWFEIPATDFERAKKFYSTILGTELQDMTIPDGKYSVFPYEHESGGVSGGIIQMEGSSPSADGSVVYLNGGDDLSSSLSRVEEAGGTILLPKTAIGENGFMAHFLDTEGNRVALHSMN
jgi:predicted enzyme related to lactoylglutathione lyase